MSILSEFYHVITFTVHIGEHAASHKRQDSGRPYFVAYIEVFYYGASNCGSEIECGEADAVDQVQFSREHVRPASVHAASSTLYVRLPLEI